MYSRTLGEKEEHQTKPAPNKLNTINSVKKKKEYCINTSKDSASHVKMLDGCWCSSTYF
jgi:hypothetical protein